jgi:hypothetical protein
MEFPIRSSLVHDPKALMICMSDNHVHVIGAKPRKIMVAYMESYISRLQRARSMTQLLNQMGWKDVNGKTLFVLGKRIFHEDGTIEDASLAKHVPGAARGYHSKGDLNKWVEATELLDQPGMEPYAFALLCGFAAPLMKFTGFDGAMVSMVGDSGIGKTLLLKWVQSIYGYHKDLMMLRDDTRNALVGRLGIYGNMPLTVDEVTNIDGMELSDLVYRITQGRDKARLTKNSEEKKAINSWNTLALVSSNSSLIDKLGGVKHDASAEVNRLFEYDLKMMDGFSGTITSDLFWTIDNNYGFAGERYIAWLTQNTQKVSSGLAKLQDKMDKEINIQGDERFWSAIAATAVYGGMVAKSLGLVHFDVVRVKDWAIQTIRGMRTIKEDLSGNSIGIFGQFLDEHTNNRILVKGGAVGGKMCTMLDAPRGSLVIRHEVDTDRLYVSRNVFRTWLNKKQGSYGRVRADLAKVGALLNANRNKVLGGGTSYAGASQPCWEIDIKCSALGAVGLHVVKAAEGVKGETG